MLSAEKLNIESGGKSQVFSQYWEDNERCKPRQEFTPERGKYATQEEYRPRVEQQRLGCDTYCRVEHARSDVPMVLSYDAGPQRFLFELPTAHGLQLQDDTLVWNDFPPVLSKLPRDHWHIDDPTPKASAYKECNLRNVSVQHQLISKIGPCRNDYWRGCMTYYLQGDENNWLPDSDTFFISGIAFYTYSEIAPARCFKNMQADLIYRIVGAMLVPEQGFEAQVVEILNRRTAKRLVSLKP